MSRPDRDPPRLRPYLAGPPAPGPDPAGEQDGAAAERMRPYQLTGGRTTPADPTLAIEAQVVASGDGLAAADRLTFEHRQLVSAARAPVSVAELGAALRLHLQVVRVLVADLTTAGHLRVVPATASPTDPDTIERVIRGLSALA
jgi:uncharacterized protein DUF742